MASHKSVVHSERGFRMSRTYAEQVMREHCSITWVVKGQTIRDTTDDERIELRAAQMQERRMREIADEIVGMPNDLSGMKFVPPKTTRYRTPYAAYVAMPSPLALRVCRWPRLRAA